MEGQLESGGNKDYEVWRHSLKLNLKIERPHSRNVSFSCIAHVWQQGTVHKNYNTDHRMMEVKLLLLVLMQA